MELSAEESAAIQASIAAKNNNPVVEPVKVEPVVTEPVVEPTKVEPTTTEPAKVEPVVTTTTTTTEPAKTEPVLSFNEQLEKYVEEQTGGKFKKFEEIKTVLDAPKVELDPEILHFQNLKKSGVVLDKDFFQLQALDVDSMEDPEEIVLEAMRRKPEFKNLSDRALKFKINEKYNINEWINKDDADLTEADLVQREIMMSDAQSDLEFLVNYKKERTFINPVNEQQEIDNANARKQILDSHAKFVDDELIAKGTSLITEVQIDKDTKESFEYKPSEAIRKKAGETMKAMAADLSTIVNLFAETDAEGKVKINDRKIFEMLVKNDTYNEAVQNAYRDGMAQGAKGFVKNDLKNASFKPEGNAVANPVAATEAEAIALAIKASQTKLT